MSAAPATGPRGDAGASWEPYLDQFHTERAGITERILERCGTDGRRPYDWVAEPLTERPGSVLDLAGGSGPLADRLTGWVGIDTSTAELAVALDRDRVPLVRASATRLPIATASVPGAVCSMGMQIIAPFRDALAELARVLRPGAVAVLLVPASRPMPWRQALTYLRLQVALRARITYPNDDALAAERLSPAAADVGLTITDDERGAFVFALDTHNAVDALLDSLYLPGVDARRLDAGRRLLRHHLGGELTIPLRRIVLERRKPLR